MGFKVFFLIALVAAVFAFENASALTCYECSAPVGNNLACETDVTSERSRTCSPGAVCTKFQVQNPGSTILSRSCAQPDICAHLELEYANNPAMSVVECKTCASDNCNSN